MTLIDIIPLHTEGPMGILYLYTQFGLEPSDQQADGKVSFIATLKGGIDLQVVGSVN